MSHDTLYSLSWILHFFLLLQNNLAFPVLLSHSPLYFHFWAPYFVSLSPCHCLTTFQKHMLLACFWSDPQPLGIPGIHLYSHSPPPPPFQNSPFLCEIGFLRINTLSLCGWSMLRISNQEQQREKNPKNAEGFNKRFS